MGNNKTPGSSRHRQPTIVRIVFSEAEEAKLQELDDKMVVIKDKVDQIRNNMSSLNWERDRMEKRIDAHFDSFVMLLQRRREDIKYELNKITDKELQTMKKYIVSLDKQTKQIKETQKKCEKYLSNTKLNKNKKKSKKDGTIKRKKEHKEKHYFVKLEKDQQ